jgi:hypothetical protein
MKFRTFGMLIASLGAFTLTLATNQAFAGHRATAHSARYYHKQQAAAIAWPYGPFVETVMEGAPPTCGTTGGVHYTVCNEAY